MDRETNNEISPLILHWMPDASLEEQLLAQENLRAWLRELKFIYERLEREGYFVQSRDNQHEGDTVDS